jgi:uncharacterized protein YecT (DUF1311 family)
MQQNHKVRVWLLATLLCAAWPGAARAACDMRALKGPALTQCLTAAEKASSDRLEAALGAAIKSIAVREGVFDAQRERWKNSLTNSEELWLRFRNAECQDVAPFEGQAGNTSVLQTRLATFDAKLACIAALNEERAADLSGRYPPP